MSERKELVHDETASTNDRGSTAAELFAAHDPVVHRGRGGLRPALQQSARPNWGRSKSASINCTWYVRRNSPGPLCTYASRRSSSSIPDAETRLALRKLPDPRSGGKLPTVLSREEVTALLDATPNLSTATLLATLTRLDCVAPRRLQLKITDIDSQRMLIWCEKEKVSGPAGHAVTQTVRSVARPTGAGGSPRLVVSGKKPGSPMHHPPSDRCVSTRRKGRIKKQVTAHLAAFFRPASAGAGTDLRTIQVLLAHGQPQNHGDLPYMSRNEECRHAEVRCEDLAIVELLTPDETAEDGRKNIGSKVADVFREHGEEVPEAMGTPPSPHKQRKALVTSASAALPPWAATSRMRPCRASHHRL